MATGPTTYINPVSGGWLDVPIPFGEFLADQYVSIYHPKGGATHIQEGVHSALLDYNMWASDPEHQEKLILAPRDYITQVTMNDAFLKSIFDIENTIEETHILHRVTFGKDIAPNHARGTLVSYVTQTQESSIVKNVYKHEGFVLDYFTADTVEGNAMREAQMRQLAWDVQRSHVLSALCSLFSFPQEARFPNQKNGSYSLCKTPVDWFLVQQKEFGIENKHGNAINMIVRNANNVFAMHDQGLSTTMVLMPASDAYYLKNFVDITNRADASGNAGAASRVSVDITLDFDTFSVVPLPFVQRCIQGEFNNTFTRPHTTGSNVNFRTLCSRMVEGYESWMRDVQYADFASRGVQTYSLYEHLCALPHYKPMREIEGEDGFGAYDNAREFMSRTNPKGVTSYSKGVIDDAGCLDFELLERFAMECSKPNGKDMMTSTGTRLYGNEQLVDEYLFSVDTRYVKGAQVKGGPVFFPTILLGQIPPERCRDDLMLISGLSLAHVIYSDLSEEESREYKKFCRVAFELFRTGTVTGVNPPPIVAYLGIPENINITLRSAVKKVLTKLNLSTESMFVEATNGVSNFYAGIDDSIVKFINIVSIIDSLTSKDLFQADELASIGVFDIPASTGKRTMDDIVTKIAIKEDKSKSINYSMLVKYPLAMPDSKNSRISTILRRLFQAMSHEPDVAFALANNLFSYRTLTMAKRRHDSNVQHPTGGMNIRPRETQEMSNALCLAIMPGRKLGKFYMGKTDIATDFEANSRRIHYVTGFSHGVGVEDGRQMHWAMNTRGGRYIGGCDSYYADQRSLVNTSYSSFQAYREACQRRGSNVALAASYNQAVDGIHAHGRCFDDRGYYHSDMARYVDNEGWKDDNQEKPVAMGLCMYNFLHKFFQSEGAAFNSNNDLTRLNFNEEVLLNVQNHVVRQLNSWTYDPDLKKFVMDYSMHVWGDITHNNIKIFCSEGNVVAEEVSEEKLKTIKKTKFDATN